MNNIQRDLGQFLPDMPKYNNPGVSKASNAYPTAEGFGPFEDLVDTGDTFSQKVQGAAQFFRNDNSAISVAGGTGALGVRTAGGVTETTGYTSILDTERWRFSRFGDQVIAVTPQNAPQYLTDLNTDEAFSDLPGSPPNAAVIGKVGDFLALGDIVGSPSRIQWSNFNDPTGAWDTNAGDLSGFKDLDAEFGRVTGIVRTSASEGIVFQERAIWLMQFVGAPLAFDFNEISVDRGCPAPDSIVAIGTSVFFLSQDGFYVTNGSSVNRIGSDRVDETFISNVNTSFRFLTQGAANWDKNCIIWSYITGEDANNYSEQLIYSFSLDKWSQASRPLLALVELKQDDVTVGDLDALYADVGSIDVAVGNEDWKGKDVLLGAWYNDGGTFRLGRFSGSSLQSQFETGLMQVSPGRRSTVTGVTPVIENQSMNTTTQIVGFGSFTDVERVSTSTVVGVDGFCPHLFNSRYISVRMTVPAGAVWDKASALIIRAREGGGR